MLKTDTFPGAGLRRETGALAEERLLPALIQRWLRAAEPRERSGRRGAGRQTSEDWPRWSVW